MGIEPTYDFRLLVWKTSALPMDHIRLARTLFAVSQHLHPLTRMQEGVRSFVWRRRRESNPPRPVRQTGALSRVLRRHMFVLAYLIFIRSTH